MKYDKLLKTLLAIIILWGIIIRIVVFLQNRDLIIDETNVARNLYERGFAGLTLPLSHEQFAPPVFLWVEKLFTLLLGFSSYSLRLYPLIAGIALLFLFVLVIKEIASLRAAWYPLFLMVVSFIYIRYSSEVKQYMPDAMIALALILTALKTDIQKVSGRYFFVLWLLVGSLAIWASMPAVFVLAGVGGYYFYICVRQKDAGKLKVICGIGMLWAAQFLFYYFAILRHEVNIKGLVAYHHDYFLFLIPKSITQLQHNRDVLLELLKQTSGYGDRAWYFNSVLSVVGIILLFKNSTSKAILVVIPMLLTFIAASYGQFSLIPRVSLFVMPLILILIGYAFDCALKIKFILLQVALILMASDVIIHHNITFALLKRPIKDELITDELLFLKKRNIQGSKVYISNGSIAAFIYYTQINPDKQQWAQLRNAQLLNWNSDYEQIACNTADTAAFLYTSITVEELNQHKASLRKCLVCIDSIEESPLRCFVYLYVKRAGTGK